MVDSRALDRSPALCSCKAWDSTRVSHVGREATQPEALGHSATLKAVGLKSQSLELSRVESFSVQLC